MARRHLYKGHGDGLAVADTKKRRGRLQTAFQQDIVTWGQDPQVRALAQARNMTYRLGEPVDGLTATLKARIDSLKMQAQPKAA